MVRWGGSRPAGGGRGEDSGLVVEFLIDSGRVAGSGIFASAAGQATLWEPLRASSAAARPEPAPSGGEVGGPAPLRGGPALRRRAGPAAESG